MNLLEEVDNYQHFDKSKIKNFIDFGNKVIENEEKLESKEFSKLFKKYSRNYMNFIMNHTNFIYLLFVYKNLLESKYNDYIKYIIKINNYVLSIISDTDFTDSIKGKTDLLQYNNYITTVHRIFNGNYNTIDLKIKLQQIVINISLFEQKYKTIDEYTEFEKNDIISFFFMNSYSLYNLTNLQILKETIDLLMNDIMDDKKKDNILKLLPIFAQSYHNIILTNFYSQVKDLQSIMNPLTKVQKNDYNGYFSSIIKTKTDYTNTIVGAVVVGFIIADNMIGII